MGHGVRRRSPRGGGGLFRRAIAVIGAVLVAVPVGLAANPSGMDAASAAVSSPVAASGRVAFDPGYIIDDSLFYDRSAMTAAEIQSFLDSKIGTCENGQCLNVAIVPFAARAARYSADFPDRLICSAVDGGNFQVSELIYRVQVACGISAKVILATLHKEQGLITKKAPSDYSLRYAMGYACPDSSGCSDANAGLGVQIYQGTRQLMTYRVSSEVWRYKPSTSGQFVAYHPDYYVSGRCGGTDVVIRNFATAALYNYTPYQPNAAALANLGTTGDNCSSYGNRNFWDYYYSWFGSPTAIIPSGVSVSRIGGNDRYSSSAAVSAANFSAGVPVVYVASGADFADAISAAPAAATQGGPVLLLERDAIPAPVVLELSRLKPQRIVIVGGTGAVSTRVEQLLAGLSPEVERVFGLNRYETSRAVLAHSFGGAVPTVYLATGSMFADALSASAAAGSRAAPVLLVDGSQNGVDEATRGLLAEVGTQNVYVSGGTGVVSPGVEQGLVSLLGRDAVVRLSGSDRYATSNAVNRERFTTATTFFVASGEAFADALSAAPVAALNNAPLYVVPQECMPRSLAEHIIDSGATALVIIGGTGAVSPAVAAFRNC